MITLINYLTAFWSVVVMNCIQPVNWQYCLPVHKWFVPEFVEGIKIYLDPSSLYSNERQALENINKDRK
tara:strand:- start:151 stop:357 length:207 start_codon:yes stop_codon:yes gene_type:complete